MSAKRLTSFLPHALAFAALAASGCQRGDVGAPCNHGSVTPPETRLVTFPALSCNDLLCVYGEDKEVPPDECATDIDCGDPSVYVCNTESNKCQLSLDYVLDRSMCSMRCSEDSDCNDQGAFNKPTAEDTSCQNGFKCIRLQQLGEFCCEKLCVCDDDLPNTMELDTRCETMGKDVVCMSDDVMPAG